MDSIGKKYLRMKKTVFENSIILFENGEVIISDSISQLVVDKIKRLAENGEAEMQYIYAVILDSTGNVASSAYWYQCSAEQGYAYSMGCIGSCYESGQGVPVNIENAMYWYKKGAEKGDCTAQFNLAQRYDLNKEYSKSAYWFEKAAVQDHIPAQRNLAVAYMKGEGVAKDIGKAVYWYKRAAENGDEYSKQWIESNYINIRHYL